MTAENPFKYFKTSPKIIRLAVMYYVRYPLSFRQVEDILRKHGTPRTITTDMLPSCGAAFREIGLADRQLCGC